MIKKILLTQLAIIVICCAHWLATGRQDFSLGLWVFLQASAVFGLYWGKRGSGESAGGSTLPEKKPRRRGTKANGRTASSLR